MKKIIALIITLVALMVAAWFVMRSQPEPVSVVDTSALENAPTITYATADRSATLSVMYGGTLARVSGLGLDTVVLSQAEAASGSRYQNEAGTTVLWNQGTAVTLYQNDVVTFSGMEVDLEKELATTQSIAGVTGNTWTWSQTMMSTGSTTIPTDQAAFTLTFTAAGQLTGTTDCNNFSGVYMLDGPIITIGSLTSTKKACADSQELDFTSIITGTTAIVFTETGDMTLLLPADAGAVIFTKTLAVPAAAELKTDNLVGTVWVWDQAALSGGSVVTPKQSAAFSLEFTTGGNVSVKTDCNNAAGSYTFDGTSLQLGPNLSMTMMACADSQESEFIKLITGPLTVATITDSELILRLPQAAGQLSFTAKD